jgi:hypothetical protein
VVRNVLSAYALPEGDRNLRQFLQVKSTTAIRPPIVTDLFSIDAMTEMLRFACMADGLLTPSK